MHRTVRLNQSSSSYSNISFWDISSLLELNFSTSTGRLVYGVGVNSAKSIKKASADLLSLTQY